MRRFITPFALLVLSVSFASPSRAQTLQEIPAGHWSYAAIDQLVAAGFAKGLPAQPSFVGQRLLTRYELASIAHRVLAHLNETPDPVEVRSGMVPTLKLVKESSRLAEEFRVELAVLGADLDRSMAKMRALESRLADLEARTGNVEATSAKSAKKVDDLKDQVDKQKAGLEQLTSQIAKHKLQGYIQVRYEAFDQGDSGLFPRGGNGGTGQTPSIGGPGAGGAFDGFSIRRARLKWTGPLSKNSDYTIQLDGSSGGQVNLRDAFVNFNGIAGKNTQLRVGQSPLMFGRLLFESSGVRPAPERSPGFADASQGSILFKQTTASLGGTVTPGSATPLLINQDRDNGLYFIYNSPDKVHPTTLTAGVINGEGRTPTGMRNQNSGVDFILRAQSRISSGLDLGISGYHGSLSVRSAPPVGGTPAPFTEASRRFLGADLRYTSPWGTIFNAEFMGGRMDTMPDRSLYLPGNHAHAWYFAVAQPIDRRTTFHAQFDEFLPVSQAGYSVAGLNRNALARRQVQFGLVRWLDPTTRWKLWYQKALTPYDPSAVAGVMRSRLGFITSELIFTY